jgi:saccharopine dehydrogenase-like NADP-dependent oxidoreductase
LKVLLLGGTGLSGRIVAALLAREDLISEIGLASRNLETAQRTANEIGDKAHAVCVDIQDLSRLSSLASDYHIIVNAAGPTSEVQVPSLKAAIEAGIHYVDLGVTGKSAQRALQFDSQMQTRGATAIISSGWLTILNLMAVHATGQLDKTERLSVCMLFDYSPGNYYSPEQCLIRAREKGRVETSWDIIETAGEPVLTYRTGRWVRLDPLEHPFDILHPSGKKITAYLMDSPSILTLPGHLPGVQTVTCLLGMIPPQLMKLFIQKGQRVTIGEIDWEEAAMEYFETAVEDKQRWLSTPPDYPSGWGMWVIASGYKGGRKAHYLCWPSMFLSWTCVPLVIVTLRILRGEVSLHGVLQSEACFELESFIDEAKKYVREDHRGKPLLNERFDWLD